jgi:Tfp pilus assembly protein PilO
MVALTVEEGELKNFYKVIPLKVQLDGELWDTLDFIEYMQNLLRLVSFDNLRLEAQPLIAGVRGEGATVGSLRTSLRVKTYSFREGAEDFKPAKKARPKKKAKKKKKGH